MVRKRSFSFRFDVVTGNFIRFAKWSYPLPGIGPLLAVLKTNYRLNIFDSSLRVLFPLSSVFLSYELILVQLVYSNLDDMKASTANQSTRGARTRAAASSANGDGARRPVSYGPRSKYPAEDFMLTLEDRTFTSMHSFFQPTFPHLPALAWSPVLSDQKALMLAVGSQGPNISVYTFRVGGKGEPKVTRHPPIKHTMEHWPSVMTFSPQSDSTVKMLLGSVWGAVHEIEIACVYERPSYEVTAYPSKVVRMIPSVVYCECTHVTAVQT